MMKQMAESNLGGSRSLIQQTKIKLCLNILIKKKKNPPPPKKNVNVLEIHTP